VSASPSASASPSSAATDYLHIFAESVIEPNHATDNKSSVLIGDDLEVQGDTYLGGVDDYIHIDSDGVQTFHGDARWWQGVFIDISRFKEPTSNSAILTNRGLGTAYKYTKNQDIEHLHTQVSIPGFWDVTADLQVILHWDSPAISGNCYWEIRYRLIAPGEDMTSVVLTGTEGDVFTSSEFANGLVHSTIVIPTAHFNTDDKKLRFQIYRMGNNGGDTIEDFIYLHGIRVRGVRYKTGGAIS